MRRMRVGVLALEPGQHRGERLERERRGRLVIEIGHAAKLRVSRAIWRQAWMKRVTSASPVVRPKLTRTTSREAASAQPIAASTWLGFMLPDEQAEPAETEMPARSKRISCAAAAVPGMR